MRKAILNYILQSFTISIVLAGSYYLFHKYGFPQFFTSSVYLLIGVLFIINCLFHAFLTHTAVNKSSAFIRYFLASTMLKLFVYIIIILLMVFLGTPLIKVFLVAFLMFYFVYTAHEVFSILQFLKKNSSQHAKSK